MSEGGVGPDVTSCFWKEMARVMPVERRCERDGMTDGTTEDILRCL